MFSQVCLIHDHRVRNWPTPPGRSKRISPISVRGTNEPRFSLHFGSLASLTLTNPRKKVKAHLYLFSSHSITGILIEFELVQNAMYTYPNDQSVWIYHAWLIGRGIIYHDRRCLCALISTECRRGCRSPQARDPVNPRATG